MKRLRLPAILLASLALAAPLAAEEPPAADAVLKAIDQVRTYDYGQSEAALSALQLQIARFAADPARRSQAAQRLAALLADAQATEAARVFACQQLLVVGGEAQVPALAKLLDDPKLADLARRTLEAMPGDAAGQALRDLLGRTRGNVLAGAINALGNRRDARAVPLLPRLAAHEDPAVPPAAIAALGKIGTAEAAAALLKLAPPPRLAPVLNDALLRCAELRAADGDAAGAEALLLAAGGPDRPVATRWAALAGLLKLDAAKAAPRLAAALADPALHALAFRGALRLADGAKDEAARDRLLGPVRAGAKTADAKKQLLAELSEIPSASALHAAAALLDDADAGADAAAAARQAGKMLVLQDRDAAETALKAIAEKCRGKASAATAEALRDEILLGPAMAGSPADRKRSEARKKELGQGAPAGHHVACYLDCGPDASDGGPKGPSLGLVAGDTWVWEGAPAPAGSVSYAGDQVVFEASGLDPNRSYQAGFSWWDYDRNGRVQSVWAATGSGGRETKLLDRTPLPPGTEKPQEKVLPVPRELYPDGKLRLLFRKEGASNAVVSELWLFESGAERAAAPGSPPAAAAVPAAVPAAAPAARKAEKQILLVTGIDYPGHKWKETAPVLARALEEDPRLGVKVVEDFNALAAPDLKSYDAIVLHFMPWEVAPPSKACQDALKGFVEGGKGLVLVHFACGAFPGWDEFVKIAGRDYDKKLRGHDPHGAFRVNIVKPDHPVVKGMEPFDTVDELYTCLGGDTPVEVLASSTSKVDKKDYPMAFVLNYGKGRVFHSPLGHDVKAFPAPVCALFRRGTAWVAGLAPTPP